MKKLITCPKVIKTVMHQLETASILNCKKGKIILSGVGKSGHIARKIASTLTSTGTHSYFIHPTEASHGDLGSIRKKDIK